MEGSEGNGETLRRIVKEDPVVWAGANGRVNGIEPVETGRGAIWGDLQAWSWFFLVEVAEETGEGW